MLTARCPLSGWHCIAGLGLIAIGIAAHAGGLTGAWVFDDQRTIIENWRIRTLWPWWVSFGGTERPLTQCSFALNYALGGLTRWGYHAVNMALHLAATVVLFDLVRRTLTRPRLAGRFGPSAFWLAWTSAALWMLHPLQTQSVTYLSQRAELLAGFWALVTLNAAARGMVAGGRGWFLLAGLACLLGMASKPVMVTAPVAVWLYDRCFVAGSWRQAWRQRQGVYLGLAATWGILALLIVTGLRGETTPTAGFALTEPTALAYAATQPGVIFHYLRLVVWPMPLCLDYGWPVARTLPAILFPAAGLGAILTAVVWTVRRHPAVGFWAAWGFLALAPSSSVIPIADLAMEHRMYLPLAGFLVTLVLLGWLGLQRLPLPARGRRVLAGGLVAGLLLALGLMTARRNADYQDELTIWQGTVAQRPDNPRAYYNLGTVLVRRHRAAEAIPHFTRALALRPASAKTHNNLGSAYLLLGQPDQALTHFWAAVRLQPAFADAHNNLGMILLQQGHADEAIAHFETALFLKPRFSAARHNLNEARARRQGRASAP